jgi:putative ABC transport system permease protein
VRLPLAVRLARRDLRGGLKGFRVFIACLALGVAAIAGIGSVSTALLEGLHDDARAMLGGDFDIRLVHRRASAEQRAWLDAHATVSEVATVRAMARPAAGDGRPLLVELKAVDDRYPLFGALETQPEIDPATGLGLRDGVRGALVDPALVARMDLSVGDRIRIGDAAFEMRGTIRQEPDRGAQMFTLGPRVLVDWAGIEAAGLLQPGSLAYYHYRVRLAQGEAPAAWRAALNAAFPDAGWRVRGPHDAAPRVTRTIERVTLFMGFVGLTALLVGGVGVGNAVGSYLTGRLRTIATLKSLGAANRVILGLYGVQVLAIAALAILIGVAVGAAVPLFAVPLLAARLSFTAAATVHVLPMAVAAAFGLLTTVAFATVPLARAARVSAAHLFRSRVAALDAAVPLTAKVVVAAALALLAALTVAVASDWVLALWFVLGAAVAVVLLRGIAAGITALARRAGPVRHPGLRLALANLCRPGAPAASMVVSLGLGLTLLVAVAVIEANLAHEVEDVMPARAPSFFLLDIQPDELAALDALVRDQPGSVEVEQVPMLRGRITAVNGTAPEDMDIPPDTAWVFKGDRGLTWAAKPPADTTLTAGTWWPPDYHGPPLVSLDAGIAGALGLKPGDTLTVNILGRPVEVTIANLRKVEWRRLGINFVMIFSPGLLESAPQSYLATVRIDAGGQAGLEQAIAERFPAVSIVSVREALEQVARVLDDVMAAIRAVAAVALMAGVLVLTGAVAAGRHRRIYDAVVFKVLGATKWSVAGTFALEFGLLGLVTAAIAAVLGCAVGFAVLTEFMHLGFRLPAGAAVGTALAALVVTLALGFAGTWRALGRPAAAVLRTE